MTGHHLLEMTRVPKSIKSHYIDSFAINSENLRSFLATHNISNSELEEVSSLLSKFYNQEVDNILRTCGDEWTRLESFPSPLILFIQCIDKLLDENQFSITSGCRFILKSFIKTLESWMIW